MTGLAMARSTWGGIEVGPGAINKYFFILVSLIFTLFAKKSRGFSAG
jgi:hypothetical protein